MESAKKHAYHLLLAQSVLHMKWDLACLAGGINWLKPWRIIHQLRAASQASERAFAFHNLAIFANQDFENFSESTFWSEIKRFSVQFPDTYAAYYDTFETALKGEAVEILKPERGSD